MAYIFLTVFISVFLLFIFKFFPKYGVNTVVAIVINYITAGITGILFLSTPLSVETIVSSQWLWLAIPLGALFVSVFYFISLTTQRIGISTASVANKMSVVMPVLFSVFFLDQSLSALKIVGILCALTAVYLSSRSSTQANFPGNYWWLPVVVFLGSGCIDISINVSNAWYIASDTESALFSITTFFSAFCAGILFLCILLFAKKITAKEIFSLKNILGGIILGVPNYFSIYFIFRSLDSHVFTSAQLFPVLNVSNVVLAAISAWLFFKEKLTAVNIAGIALAILSIVLIAL